MYFNPSHPKTRVSPAEVPKVSILDHFYEILAKVSILDHFYDISVKIALKTGNDRVQNAENDPLLDPRKPNKTAAAGKVVRYFMLKLHDFRAKSCNFNEVIWSGAVIWPEMSEMS